MRVCVHHAGFAVGCPAGMPDAAAALHGFAFIGHFAQHAQASLGLDHFNFAGGVLHSKAGRVIPALQPRQKIEVVHNGIIENYQELKTRLINKGFTFASQTDTEVVAQLLDYYYTGVSAGDSLAQRSGCFLHRALRDCAA